MSQLNLKFLDKLNQFSQLQQRIISAAVLLVIVMLLIYLGGLFFAIPVLAMSCVAFYEWTGFFFDKEAPKEIVIAGAGALTISAFFAFYMSLGFVAMFLLLGMIGVAFVAHFNGACKSVLGLAMGAPYIGLTMAILIHLRDDGLVETTGMSVGAVIMLLLIVWTTDTAAYFAGKNFGKHKLAPSISPGKTVEGLIGGAIGAAVVAALLSQSLLGVNPIFLFFVGGILAVISQGGDLLESAMKRGSGKKDSGNIIPGHGGILDRIDGLLAATPFYIMFISFLGS